MCGGFIGDVLGKVDPIFNKNNPVERKKRIADEQMQEADRKAAEAKAGDLAAQTSNNQALQAEAVASRRRKAAQSLLGSAGPNAAVDDVVAGSNLSRGRAYAVRSSLG